MGNCRGLSMKYNRVIQIIYHRVINKHPKWTTKQVWACVDWCYKKQNKRIRRKKNEN